MIIWSNAVHMKAHAVSQRAHLFGSHSCLEPGSHCVQPRRKTQVIHALRLLSYRILGVNLSTFSVALLDSFFNGFQLLLVVLLALLTCHYHLFARQLQIDQLVLHARLVAHD